MRIRKPVVACENSFRELIFKMPCIFADLQTSACPRELLLESTPSRHSVRMLIRNRQGMLIRNRQGTQYACRSGTVKVLDTHADPEPSRYSVRMLIQNPEKMLTKAPVCFSTFSIKYVSKYESLKASSCLQRPFFRKLFLSIFVPGTVRSQPGIQVHGTGMPEHHPDICVLSAYSFGPGKPSNVLS